MEPLGTPFLRLDTVFFRRGEHDQSLLVNYVVPW